MGELLSARKVREQSIVDVDLGDGTFVRARKTDLSTMVFEGLVTTPLMAAAQKFIENREMSPAERIAEVGMHPQHAWLFGKTQRLRTIATEGGRAPSALKR